MFVRETLILQAWFMILKSQFNVKRQEENIGNKYWNTKGLTRWFIKTNYGHLTSVELALERLQSIK